MYDNKILMHNYTYVHVVFIRTVFFTVKYGWYGNHIVWLVNIYLICIIAYKLVR